ncbi:MAG: CDP-alcohol phosphatidyltransferase family protein [Planctomycetaceae bacterium]|nr:CDP-alcohol phosphatidyltransferase family protein [Planctomycetaceae bacterium]
MNPKWLAAIPNGLTVGRLLAGLAFPWIPPEWWFGVMIAAGISDLIDGTIGRLLHVSSDFGRVVDPIADKTFVVAAIVTLWWHERLAGWELVLLGARDWAVLAISGITLWLDASQTGEWQPRFSGKIATGGQFAWLLAVAGLATPPRWLFVLAVAVSAWAAIDYSLVAIKAWRKWHSRRTKPLANRESVQSPPR